MEFNIAYCGEQCEIGKKVKKTCLANCDSIFDAVSDFWNFTENCAKTCKYKLDRED